MRVTIDEAIELLDPWLVKRDGFNLSPTPLPVPPAVLEDAMLTFLRKLVRRRPPLPGMRYGCMEAAVLEHGQTWRANLGMMSVRDMEPGACFDNCYAVSQLGALRYAEGYAIMDGAAEPWHHAWLVNAIGQVEDPTWQQVWRKKLRTQPSRIWSGDAVYIGVTIEPWKHRLWKQRTLYPNLLSVCDDEVQEVLQGRLPWI